MEDDTGMTDSEAVSSCSVSSLLPHCSSEELLANAENLQTTAEEVEKIGRARKLLNKLNRGNALNLQPKLSSFSENIDLTTPDDNIDPFAKQFPHLVKSRSKVIKSAPEKPRNGVDAQKRVKEQLSSRLAARRRAEQAKRRALYAEDNEDIRSDDEEEEEYEVKKKTKLSKPKPIDSDNSEDDVDYKEGEEGSDEGGESSGSENEDEEEEEAKESEAEDGQEEESQAALKESEDVFASQSPMKPVDLADFLEIPEVASQEPTAPSQLPPSLSQFWAGTQRVSSQQEGSGDSEASDDDDGEQIMDKKQIKDDDLLMFCSGAFDLPPPKPKPVEVENDEEEIICPTQHKTGRKRMVQSDDEDETEETPKADEEKLSDPVEESAEEVNEDQKEGTRRVVLLSDEESDEEDGGKEDDEKVEEPENEEEDAENEEEEDNAEESEEEEEKVDEGDGGSDDELAVFRRMERAEYKKKVKLDTFVDEEADLSGDDVGSDADEDGEDNNEYEAQECDGEVFDSNDMRRKNHKLFMKQEQQEIHRDIAKLQDRLLADGDLGGVETNRSFRVKLRTEEVEVDLSTLNEYSQESIVEEETVEDEKKRADAIRFKADMHSVISNVESDPFDDALEHAASAALLSKITAQEPRTAPTLLGKMPLGNAVKDVSGGIAVRQMYKQAADSSLLNNKRPSDCAGNVAKKHKLNLLDSLDD